MLDNLTHPAVRLPWKINIHKGNVRLDRAVTSASWYRYCSLGLLKIPFSVLMKAARDFGDVVRLPGGAGVPYFVNHPDFIKHVLQENNRNYCKQNRFNNLLKPFIGEGLLTSDGEAWRRRRRLAQPAFHRHRLALLVQLMTDTIEEIVARWQPVVEKGTPLDVLVETQRIALTIFGRALFSVEVRDLWKRWHVSHKPSSSTSITAPTIRYPSPFLPPVGIAARCKLPHCSRGNETPPGLSRLGIYDTSSAVRFRSSPYPSPDNLSGLPFP